jgi:hypothetical protein
MPKRMSVDDALIILVNNYSNPDFTPNVNREQGVKLGNIVIKELNRLEEKLKQVMICHLEHYELDYKKVREKNEKVKVNG